MQYRSLGRTGIKASEICLGAEHLDNTPYENVASVVDAALDGGVNIIDAFMSGAEIRTNLGRSLGAQRKNVVLQGHIGAVQRDGQYSRSRNVKESDTYIRDFLTRFNTDYIDLGMIHFVDTDEDFDAVFHSPFIEYALELKKTGHNTCPRRKQPLRARCAAHGANRHAGLYYVLS